MYRQLDVEPISAEEFAAFGEVLENKTTVRRRDFSLQFGADNGPRLWVNRIPKVGGSPVRVDEMESHPYSAQTFVPMQQGRCLVVVAPPDGNGRPDLAGMRAFLTEGGQGVTYRPHVWHYTFSSVDGPNEVVVIMGYSGRGDDTVVVRLDEPVDVPLPA
ncbi:ureidoglycolate lyase [Herbaspirillum chlorophenolicum]|uniref:Ureidoglycolate lyase n=1 Tax=Herbaspirillum chlorophenolicum TaxID=211589 RepID=A0ABW8F0I4_9BURK|nr:ureidoglycolate lyase [Herbaspirillum chlorophenolicum]